MGKFTDEELSLVLRENHKTIAAAESITGGLLSSRLTSMPGSSEYFIGGLVSYHSRIKVSELNIPGSIIAKEGVVSEEVARLMAEGIRKKFKCDIGISTTGAAGPSPLPPAPVGLVYIAVASEYGTDCQKIKLQGSREEIRGKVVEAAVGLLYKNLREEKS
jgi:PncC family amidohydrolase